MAKLLRLRRGTDTQHTTFTGAEGEVTVNTTNDSLHVHDGATAGGTELAKADLSNVDGNLSNDLGFGDSVKATFGAGDDLQIYHNGTESIIKDNGTGALILQSDPGVYIQSADGTKTSGVFNPSGAVTLRHDHQQKLATTSTGIDVTGTVTCDGLTSDGDTTIRNATGTLILRDSADSGSASQQYISGVGADAAEDWHLGQRDSSNPHVQFVNKQAGDIRFATSDAFRVYIDSNGHLNPYQNNTYDLGTSSNQWRNSYFSGTVTCDGLSCDGIGTFTGGSEYQLIVKDSNNTGTAAEEAIGFQDSAGTTQGYIGYVDNGSETLWLFNTRNSNIVFGTNNTARCQVNSSGHFIPNASNTYDLGGTSNRWRNVYTNDLNLSNEGGANDVDGTWGSWTIQEGEDDLFLLNRRNGKKYKFNLSEVN